jgi:hypothetical protein
VEAARLPHQGVGPIAGNCWTWDHLANSTEVEAMRKLKFLWKDTGSGGGGCPALYETEGGYVVQGLALDAESRAQLQQLADGEIAVFVPANVLDRMRG